MYRIYIDIERKENSWISFQDQQLYHINNQWQSLENNDWWLVLTPDFSCKAMW